MGYGGALGYLALIVFWPAAAENDLPAAIVGLLAFVIVHLIWPECRFNLTTPLGLGNLAQLLFGIQFMVFPLLIKFYGFSRGALPWLPSHLAVNFTLVLMASGYVIFSAMYHYTLTSRKTAAKLSPPSVDLKKIKPLVFIYAAIGILGLYLYHGSWQGYLNYLTDPGSLTLIKRDETASLSGAASTFFRPFMGFALVMAWSYWLDKNRSNRSWPRAGLGTLLLLLAFPLVNTFNYNRGSIVAPMIAVLAAYSLRVSRLSLKFLVIGGCILFVFVSMLGAYRNLANPISRNRPETISIAAAADPQAGVEFAQIYLSAPQFAAFLIEESHSNSKIYWGSTLLSSVLYPLPMLGKSFRSTSGVMLYNALIYSTGNSGARDQVLPYIAEFFINFHLPGVIIGYMLLGYVLARLQHSFETAHTTFDAYGWFYMGIWLLFPGSVPVTSQVCIYLLWPFYIYQVYTPIMARQHATVEKGGRER
ncbi:MAG: O-antigen polysaccharide polymerase Wzy [Chloroflexota bacterium]